LHDRIYPLVVAIFTLIRGIIGPIIVAHVAHGVLTSTALPRHAAAAWAAMCSVVVLGSWLWLRALLLDFSANKRAPAGKIAASVVTARTSRKAGKRA
jgi:hypothetical protein